MFKFISYQLCKLTYSTCTLDVCRYTSDLGIVRLYHLAMNKIFNTHEEVSLKHFMAFHNMIFFLL